MANNIINHDTLNFKALHTENKTHDDLVVEGLREELTHKETPRRLKDSRVLKMVSEDLPIKENKKEKKFLNNLHFYEGEDAVVEEEVCVPFLDFIECLASLGYVYSNYQTVYKNGKEFTRYTIIPDSENCVSIDELKDTLTELYKGKVNFGKATYKYAPEINYLTVIVPNSCNDDAEFEENNQSRDAMLRENVLYKKGKRIQEQNLMKFCEDNIPAGETLFYVVKNAEGDYLINEGSEESPNYWFDNVTEEEAEAFNSVEDAEDAIREYAWECAYPMDWQNYYDENERVTDPDGRVHPDYDIIDKDCDEFLKECDIIPIGTRKVNEAIKGNAQKRLAEAKGIIIKQGDEYLVNEGDKETVSRFFTQCDKKDAEVFNSKEEAEDAIAQYIEDYASNDYDAPEDLDIEKAISDIKNACEFIPLSESEIKELKESTVGDVKRDVAFFIVKDDNGNYLCKNDDGYFLDTDIDNAEVYELQDDAEDDIYLYNVDKEEETEFKIISVYINDLYVKEYGITGNLKI